MKLTIKIAAIMIVASITLLLLGKHEAFLEMHYDTLDQRIIERTSLLGMTLNETISPGREGYSQRYHSIYGIDPSYDRWHSVSMRPIRKTALFTEYHLSVMTPPAVLFRNMIAEEIFKRYWSIFFHQRCLDFLGAVRSTSRIIHYGCSAGSFCSSLRSSCIDHFSVHLTPKPVFDFCERPFDPRDVRLGISRLVPTCSCLVGSLKLRVS